MKHAKPIGTVTTPRTPREGIALLPWCQDVNRSIQQLRDRPVLYSSGSRGGGGAILPFAVSLEVAGTAESPTYSVTVSDGWLNERIPGVNDPVTNATAVHKPHNILWGADGASQDPVKAATDRRSFPITIGQQVSAIAYVSAEGAIELPTGSTEDGPTKIAVETEDEKSIHYVPPRPLDEDEGSAGEYHYKLAILRDIDATHTGPWLELFLAGSHLDHFAELPIVDNTAAAATNKGRVFWKYDPETSTYLYRAIDCTEGELNIVETDEGLGLRGNSKDGTITIALEDESTGIDITFADGLWTVEGDQTLTIPAAPTPPAGWWGTCLFEHYAEVGDTSPYLALQQTFENGVLVSVAVQDPGNVLTAVTGTELAPGAANFASNGGSL